MTREEAVILCRYVKAACPQQAIDVYTPDAWHDLLGDLDIADCKAAIAAVAKRQPFVAPAEIREEVRRIRGERVGPDGPGLHPLPPAADPDDVPAYLAALRVQQTQLASGHEPAMPALTAAERRRDYDQNPHVQSIAAQFRAERDAATRRKAERARAESAALKVYRAAVDHLLALDDHGQAATDAARDELLGDEQAARGFPLLRDATGVTDEHRITIWAARSTGWSEDR